MAISKSCSDQRKSDQRQMKMLLQGWKFTYMAFSLLYTIAMKINTQFSFTLHTPVFLLSNIYPLRKNDNKSSKYNLYKCSIIFIRLPFYLISNIKKLYILICDFSFINIYKSILLSPSKLLLLKEAWNNISFSKSEMSMTCLGHFRFGK